MWQIENFCWGKKLIHPSASLAVAGDSHHHCHCHCHCLVQAWCRRRSDEHNFFSQQKITFCPQLIFYCRQKEDHSISKHVQCFARSVEDLQYTLLDFYLVIVYCLDSCLPSLPGNFLKASACRSFERSTSLARPPTFLRSMRVTIIVAVNGGNKLIPTIIPSWLLAACSNQEV